MTVAACGGSASPNGPGRPTDGADSDGSGRADAALGDASTGANDDAGSPAGLPESGGSRPVGNGADADAPSDAGITDGGVIADALPTLDDGGGATRGDAAIDATTAADAGVTDGSRTPEAGGAPRPPTPA